MIKETIGVNAGLVWQALEDGALSIKALKKSTKLKDKELNLALGWLAREDKLVFVEEGEELVVDLHR